MTNDELVEKYGWPKRLPDRIDGLVLAFEHDSYEAALAYVVANRENYGHPGGVELDDGTRWVSTVDLRPALDEAKRRFEEGQ